MRRNESKKVIKHIFSRKGKAKAARLQRFLRVHVPVVRESWKDKADVSVKKLYFVNGKRVRILYDIQVKLF